MFNSYLWKLYLDSDDGRKQLAYYKSLTTMEVKNNFNTLSIPADDKGTPWDIIENIFKISKEASIKSSTGATSFFNDLAKNGIVIDKAFTNGVNISNEFKKYGIDYRREEICDNIDIISHAMFCANSECFFPFYGVVYRHYEEIFLQNEINMPEKPSRTDFIGRACYYSKINEVLLEYRDTIGLDPYEFATYINEFCYLQLEGIPQEVNSHPRVWIIIGGNGSMDFDFLDSSTEKSVEHWHANSYVRAGDILIMYCMSPRKCFHSIWRAAYHGTINPFFFYYDEAWIRSPIKIPSISLSELRSNSVWKNNGAVRANMQGAYRHFIQNIEYNELLTMLDEKGFDTSNLPKLPNQSYHCTHPLEKERDVEQYLVEPFLKLLGYKPSDWMRQMPIRMGRGERYYPDYAIVFNNVKNEESAKLLVEAKFKITSTKDFDAAYHQLQSYGLRLQAKVLVIASSEGVWIFEKSSKNTFSANDFMYFDWDTAYSEKTTKKVESKIGKHYI